MSCDRPKDCQCEQSEKDCCSPLDLKNIRERVDYLYTLIESIDSKIISNTNDINSLSGHVVTLQNCEGDTLKTGDTVATCSELTTKITDIRTELRNLVDGITVKDCDGNLNVSAPSCAAFNSLVQRVDDAANNIISIFDQINGLRGQGGGVSQDSINAIQRAIDDIRTQIAQIDTRLKALEGRSSDDDDDSGGSPGVGFGWPGTGYNFKGWSIQVQFTGNSGTDAPLTADIEVTGPPNSVFALEGIDGSMHVTPRAPGVPLHIQKLFYWKNIKNQNGGILYVVHGGNRVAGAKIDAKDLSRDGIIQLGP